MGTNPYSVCHVAKGADALGADIYTIDCPGRGMVGYVVVRLNGSRDYLGINGKRLARKPLTLDSGWDQAVNSYLKTHASADARETPLMNLSCIPVDCEENRIYSLMRGMPQLVFWQAPYPGSIIRPCTNHGGPVWVGPAQQKVLRAGKVELVLCSMCELMIFGQAVLRVVAETETVLSKRVVLLW